MAAISPRAKIAVALLSLVVFIVEPVISTVLVIEKMVREPKHVVAL